ncbi:ATP-binding protein [Vibrio sp. SCSIO 43135]|uniref:AAA family ATPase n=1 Tax=Vibrio sp. SCSIO 43135 TaxID=2819096 RepID=UPI002076516F|nr:AAA family ATPase [Vibrio sp. SCSIO 43135]USD42841.1 ATP-binding protein [Vibrio sp. SCSIO 43135]
MNNKVVFTGGPGAGKTSVIEYLKQLGFPSAPEVGRKVIQTQVATDGRALPWKNKAEFRDEMVAEEHNNYLQYGCSELTFFDRSIIDCYGYSRLENISLSESLLMYCNDLKYHNEVFVFPPWEAIYRNDLERKQSFREAVETYDHITRAYEEYGYDLIEVPKVSVEERAEFVLSSLSVPSP